MTRKTLSILLFCAAAAITAGIFAMNLFPPGEEPMTEDIRQRSEQYIETFKDRPLEGLSVE